MNDQDKLKLAQLKKFQKAIVKLMDKYPDIMLFGDMHGDVQASRIDPQRPYQLTTIKLTYGGKVVK